MTADSFAREKSKKVYLIYTVLFCAIGVVAFCWFILAKKSLIHVNDGFDLWYPSFVYIRRVVAGVLSGHHLSLWSWTAGIGGDFWGNFNIFLDPFNYIAAAFPVRHLDFGYGLATFLRLYCAGFAAVAFFRSRGFSSAKTLIAGFSYAFSAFALWCIIHPQFLTALVLFPLVILGIDRADEKRKPLLLIISVALSLVTSVYFSYMTAVFAGIYFILKYFFLDTARSVGHFLLRLCRFVLYVLAALMIASPFVLCMVLTLMQASTDSGVPISFFHSLKQYFMFIPDMLNGTQFFGNYSATAVGGLFVALIPAMFLAVRKKAYRLPIVMFFVSVLCALSPKVCSILNGFSYAVGRWFYALIFFFIWAGLACLDALADSQIDLRKYRTGLIITGVVIFANVLLAGLSGLLGVANLMVTMLSVAFFFFAGMLLTSEGLPRRRVERLLVAAAALNVAVMWVIIWNPFSSGELSNFVDLGTSGAQYERSMLREVSNIDDSDFFRTEYAERIRRTGEYNVVDVYVANEQLYTNVPTVKYFASYKDSDWRSFDEALSNNGNYYARVKSLGNDGRSRMNFLMGVKYFISTEENSVYAGYGYSYLGSGAIGNIYKNDFDAALGYVYSSVIREDRFYDYSYTDREQLMMQAAVVGPDYDGLASVTDPSDLETDTRELPYEIVETQNVEIGNGTLNVSQNSGTVRLRVHNPENCELYIFWDELFRVPVTLEDIRRSELGDDPGMLSRILFVRNHLTDREHIDQGDFIVTYYRDSVVRQVRNSAGTSNQAITDVTDYLSNLGYIRDEGDTEITIRFSKAGSYTFDSLQILAVSQDAFDEQAEALSENRLTITENRGDYLKGNVDSEGGLLFLSIPDSGGWSVSIDGEPAERLYHVNIGFIGVDVPAGEHTVELRYSPNGYRVCCAASILGIALTVCIVLFNRKNRKKAESLLTRAEDPETAETTICRVEIEE